MTDIDRVNAPRAAINKHLGKAAGRGTDIKTNTVSGIKPKMIQRRRQFDAAPRDIRMCCAGPQRCVDRNLFRRLAYNPFIGGDEACRNGGLCFGGLSDRPRSTSRRSARCRVLKDQFSDALHELLAGTMFHARLLPAWYR